MLACCHETKGWEQPQPQRLHGQEERKKEMVLQEKPGGRGGTAATSSAAALVPEPVLPSSVQFQVPPVGHKTL